MDAIQTIKKRLPVHLSQQRQDQLAGKGQEILTLLRSWGVPPSNFPGMSERIAELFESLAFEIPQTHATIQPPSPTPAPGKDTPTLGG